MRDLTTRQREVVAAISGYWRDHGYAPSLRDLGDALGISSKNALKCHLQLLAKKGAVIWEPRTARTLRVVERAVD